MPKERRCKKCGELMVLTDCNGLVDVYEDSNHHIDTVECDPEQKAVAVKDRNERFAQLLYQLNENPTVILGHGSYYTEVFFKADGVVIANEMKALHDMLYPYDIKIEIAGKRTIRIYSP